jgi:hypothetical protein
MPQPAATRSWECERLFTFSDLARRSDLPVQKSQWVFRHWARRGVALNGNPRKRVRLPCVKIGRVRYTSVEALREFIASLNRAAK